MLVSVIIRTYNEEKWISECIKKIEAQEFKGGVEILVVDSESIDSTVKLAEKYNVKVIKIPKAEFTYGRALNLGSKNAKGKYLVYVSAHCIPKSNKWLSSLISNFKNDVAGVYGPQFPHPKASLFQRRRMSFFVGKEKIIHQKPPVFFSNSNCALPKNLWKRNPINEQVSFREDKLWANEMLSRKYKIIYEPLAGVYHFHSFSLLLWFKRAVDVGFAPRKNSFKIELFYFLNFFRDTYLDWTYKGKLSEKIIWFFMSPLYNFAWLIGSLFGRIKFWFKKWEFIQ